MEVNHDVLVILGKSFLTTGGALIDVAVGNLILRLNDEYITFKIYEKMIYPKSSFAFPCFQVDLFKELIREFQVKRVNEKFMEHDHVNDESDTESNDEANRSELENPQRIYSVDVKQDEAHEGPLESTPKLEPKTLPFILNMLIWRIILTL